MEGRAGGVFRREQRIRVVSQTIPKSRLREPRQPDIGAIPSGSGLLDGGGDSRLGLCFVGAPGQERSESIWSRAASGCLEDRFFFGEKRGGGCEVAGPD